MATRIKKPLCELIFYLVTQIVVLSEMSSQTHDNHNTVELRRTDRRVISRNKTREIILLRNTAHLRHRSYSSLFFSF